MIIDSIKQDRVLTLATRVTIRHVNLLISIMAITIVSSSNDVNTLRVFWAVILVFIQTFVNFCGKIMLHMK